MIGERERAHQLASGNGIWAAWDSQTSSKIWKALDRVLKDTRRGRTEHEALSSMDPVGLCMRVAVILNRRTLKEQQACLSPHSEL